MTRFRLLLGDITQVQAEAIVNSTSASLLEGGPVHEAIHRAAGPGLAEECSTLKRLAVGEAVATRGHELDARFVLHTVPPTWMGGGRHELDLLENCYKSCLQKAADLGVKTIAFPSLGAGPQPQIPLEASAPRVVHTLQMWVQEHALPEQVLFVCIEPTTFQIHQRALREMLP